MKSYFYIKNTWVKISIFLYPCVNHPYEFTLLLTPKIVNLNEKVKIKKFRRPKMANA